MRTVGTLWRDPVVLLALAAIVAILLYNGIFVNPANYQGYWLSTFTNATIFLIFSCPVAAVGAAMAANRARRARLWSLPLVRSRLSITVGLLLPPFLAGLTVQGAGLAVLAPTTWGAPPEIPYGVVVAWVAIVAFHTSVGYVLGRFLPVAFSVPLAVFASYCWLGFTWALDYFPVRYLSGLIIAACCSIDTILDERAVVAVIVFSAPMTAALLLVSSVRSPGSHGRELLAVNVIATVLAVISVWAGLHTAQGLDAQPVTARPTSSLECTSDAPSICVYPEHLQHGDPRPTLAAAYENLADAGISLPSRVTASNTAEDQASLRVVLTTRPTPDELVYTISAGLIPDDVAPYCDDGADYEDRIRVAALAVWWLQTVAGEGLVDGPPRPSGLTDGAEELIADFAELSEQEQRDWYQAASPSLLDCSSKPIGVGKP